MDTGIVNEGIELNYSPPKTKRRRSSFFEKRESIIPVPPIFQDAITDEAKVEKHNLDEDQLKIYHEKLLSEKAAWKQMYNERRKKLAKLPRKWSHKELQRKTIDESYSLLSDEDIEFLKAKPDIDKINNQARKFCKEVEFTLQLKMELHRKHFRLMENIKAKADGIQENIFNHSTV